MRSIIETQLSIYFDKTLVHELLQAHSEAKRNFYLGGFRLAEVEGGRFCEAAFRILEQASCAKTGVAGSSAAPFTPIGKQLDSEKLINVLKNLPTASHSESIRLHIPRALRLVYDIRNKRDAAHLADGIDPNLQDATVVTANLDWVLAEFIRLYHRISPNDASAIVDSIVTRLAPVVQDFNGFLKILNPALSASDHILVLLYQCGKKGAVIGDINSWVRPKMRTNLKRTLSRLVDDLDLAHFDGTRYHITRLGQHEVEKRKLLN